MQPAYQSDAGAVRLYQGDVLDVLSEMESESVHCVVTSPPYWGLRDYGCDGQIGLEATPAEYITKMVAVFREVRRVLRSDGVCWVNMGDSYSGSVGNHNGLGQSTLKGRHRYASRGAGQPPVISFGDLKPKDLCGIPWQFSFALRDDGWWLRSDVIWHKPNPMPESVTDRPTKSHEYVFLLSKSASYFYDNEAIKEASVDPESLNGRNPRNADKFVQNDADGMARTRAGFQNMAEGSIYATRNVRTVWTFSTQSYEGAHFATFPEALPERCIKAGTSAHGCCPECGAAWERTIEKSRTFESGSGRSGNPINGKQGPVQGGGEMGDIRKGPCVSSQTTGWQPPCECGRADVVPCTVLDPFAGSGTTLAVAYRLGRNAVGIELNPAYVDLARKRIGAETEAVELFHA